MDGSPAPAPMSVDRSVWSGDVGRSVVACKYGAKLHFLPRRSGLNDSAHRLHQMVKRMSRPGMGVAFAAHLRGKRLPGGAMFSHRLPTAANARDDLLPMALSNQGREDVGDPIGRRCDNGVPLATDIGGEPFFDSHPVPVGIKANDDRQCLGMDRSIGHPLSLPGQAVMDEAVRANEFFQPGGDSFFQLHQLALHRRRSLIFRQQGIKHAQFLESVEEPQAVERGIAVFENAGPIEEEPVPFVIRQEAVLGMKALLEIAQSLFERFPMGRNGSMEPVCQ